MAKIDIVIPIQRYTKQSERTFELLQQFHNDVETELHIIERPDLNVSEARQLVLNDDKYEDLICYLDDDSEMIMDHWLDHMLALIEHHPKAGAIFGGEWWGTEKRPEIHAIPGGHKLDPHEGGTPAACMLISKKRLTPYCYWDQNIGLRNGWLGGDFEEVDFCCRLDQEGLTLHQATESQFHHMGGKTTWANFDATDRAICTRTMRTLLWYKYRKWPLLDDFFNKLQYVKADPNDDCMLACGETLKKAYYGVLREHQLHKHPQFTRGALV